MTDQTAGAYVTRPYSGLFRYAPASWIGLATCAALLFTALISIAFRLQLVSQKGAGWLSVVGVALATAFFVARLWRPGTTAYLLRDFVGICLALLALAGTVSCTLAMLTTRQNYAPEMWRQFIMAFAPFALYFVFDLIAQDVRYQRVIVWSFDIFSLTTIASLLGQLLGLFSGESYGDRMFGVLGDSVAWLLSAVCVTYLSRGRWAMLAIALVCLLATASRGAILISLAACFLYWLLRPVQTNTSILGRTLSLGAFGVAMVAAPILAPSVVERFRSTNFASNDRLDTMALTFDVFRMNPLVGSGYNAHTHYFAEMYGRGHEGLQVSAVPVSTLAQTLADFGIVGFVLIVAAFLGMMMSSLGVLRRRIDLSRVDAPQLRFDGLCRGLAAWLLVFLPLNQSASYLLPLSTVETLVLAAAGLVVGYGRWKVQAAPAPSAVSTAEHAALEPVASR